MKRIRSYNMSEQFGYRKPLPSSIMTKSQALTILSLAVARIARVQDRTFDTIEQYSEMTCELTQAVREMAYGIKKLAASQQRAFSEIKGK